MTDKTQLSQRIQSIKTSPTMAITGKARMMQGEGIDVISFSAGEPDFDTPQNIKDAAVRAIEAGETKYTPVGGTLALKKAIQKKLKRDQGLDYTLSEIIVTCGGKQGLYNLFQVLLNPGDEVIIPAPYWVSYPDQVILAEGKPVILETSDKNNFCITADELSAAITDKTKIFVINSPSNPSGAAYTREQLMALSRVCLEKGILIISDEIYEKVLYDGFESPSIATLDSKLKDITFIVNGVSKAYAMTGWRMGYTAGPEWAIAAMSKLQGQSTSGICSITQAACVEALDGPQDEISKMVKAFKKRRDFLVDELNGIPDIKCLTPQGAFYVFPNIKSLLGRKTKSGKTIETDTDFCNFLLEEFHVALVPGEGFGTPGYMRMSYATSDENIAEGLKRIKKAISALE